MGCLQVRLFFKVEDEEKQIGRKPMKHIKRKCSQFKCFLCVLRVNFVLSITWLMLSSINMMMDNDHLIQS